MLSDEAYLYLGVVGWLGFLVVWAIAGRSR